MYKETDRKQIGFRSILAFVLLAYALHFVLGVIPVLNIIKDVVFIGVMVAFVLIFIKRYLTTYEYELTDEKIIITAHLGDRERGRAEVEYGFVKFFCKDDDCLKNINAETQTLCTKNDSKYALVFDTDTRCMKIVFAPSEKMVSLLKDKLESAVRED